MTIMMTPRPAEAFEADALATLTRAFEADPPVRWLWPDLADHRAHFPAFARALGGRAFGNWTAETAPGGTALWLAPGVEPDEEALAEVIGATIPEARQEAVGAVLFEMGLHHPDEPHWYLPLIGVVPEAQGRGLGTALMHPVLARCDTLGLPAYLEATTEDSARLYARLGFEQTGTIAVADCPPILPMVRRPR